MLMDLYLKQKDYRRACLVAHEVMLQENNKNELTLNACLLSCMKYLSESKNKPEQIEEPESNTDEDEKKVSESFFIFSQM